MNNRITLISLIEKNEMHKINNLMNIIEEKNCKVPYGINDDKRYEIDNLPYHFTIFATNKENQNQILELTQIINIKKIQVKINDVKIMNARYNSYCLYLSIEENDEIKKLQRIFYNKFPKERYNPDNFTFHMTLHIDNDYNKILSLQKKIKGKFKPFSITFNKLALYDYPGDLIEKISMN